MSGYVPIRPPTAQSPAHTQPLTFVPHALPIVECGLFLAMLAILLWHHHVQFVKRCTCQERGTFLKPKWKKYDDKKGRE